MSDTGLDVQCVLKSNRFHCEKSESFTSKLKVKEQGKKKSNTLGNKSTEGILRFIWMMMPTITPHPQNTSVGNVIFGKYLIGFYSQNFLVIFSHLIHSLVYGIDNLIDVIERIYNCSAFITPFQHVDIFLCYSACQ